METMPPAPCTPIRKSFRHKMRRRPLISEWHDPHPCPASFQTPHRRAKLRNWCLALDVKLHPAQSGFGTTESFACRFRSERRGRGESKKLRASVLRRQRQCLCAYFFPALPPKDRNCIYPKFHAVNGELQFLRLTTPGSLHLGGQQGHPLWRSDEMAIPPYAVSELPRLHRSAYRPYPTLSDPDSRQRKRLIHI